MAKRTGDGGNNVLRGTLEEDVIRGFGGNDTIFDGQGNDQIFGGRGNDRIENGGGSDLYDGGRGVDTLVTDVSMFPPDFVLLFDAKRGVHGRQDSDIGQDELVSVENFIVKGEWDTVAIGDSAANRFVTSLGDDVLRGYGGNDRLVAGAGEDRLFGGSGRDKLTAGKGADDLFGGGGADRLKGGGGADEIVGGKGRDVLFGGGGRDVFVFKRGDGVDRIKDFQNGRDLIEIDSGASRFRDLDISKSGSNAIVEFANVRIVVEDTRVGQLTADDFLF